VLMFLLMLMLMLMLASLVRTELMRDWLEIRDKTTHDSLAYVSKISRATCICFKFWLVHWFVFVLCDWPEWFGFGQHSIEIRSIFMILILISLTGGHTLPDPHNMLTTNWLNAKRGKLFSSCHVRFNDVIEKNFVQSVRKSCRRLNKV